MSKEALHDRVRNDYAAHPPKSPAIKALFDAVALAFEEAAHFAIEACPEGRELSLCLTDLESAKRNAIAAIACHQERFEIICPEADDIAIVVNDGT